AAWALGDLGTRARSAVPDLMKLLTDPAENVRRCATNSLERITRPPRRDRNGKSTHDP
ncbi:MAG: HEAT repeat domain-containing protein, partial [Limisphaerales bacterium]